MQDKKRHKEKNSDTEGFSNSSDSEELIHYNQFHDDHLREEEKSPRKKEKLPSPKKIADRKYSLQPDRFTGWKSRLELPTPIPLLQCNPYIDPLLKKLSDSLVFLGPRYPTTFEYYENMEFINPYEHIKKLSLQYKSRQFRGNRPSSDDCLLFDSSMEEGNLDAAVKVGEDEYELFLRVDANTKGHIQWFFFTVKRMKKGRRYKFHICNLQKHNSLYTRGGRPYVRSKKAEEYEGKSWQQKGQNVKYERKPTKSAKIANVEIQPMYKLTFTFQPTYEDDDISFAYSIPYTYSQLERFLTEIKSKKPFICETKLCSSLSGLNVPLLTIHERDEISAENKKCVVVSGRAHPGESNGSYMMEGFIRFISGESSEARILRKKIVFKVVPMLNPDGVVVGNHRTGLSGKDFNREFKATDAKLFPEVDSLKKLIHSCKEKYKQNLLMFLDFHGHSVKKNAFMYGPQFSIIEKHYYSSRIFPKLLGDCTKMFRYHSCIFKISEFKNTTARAVVLHKMSIPNSYTLQVSNCSYYDHELKKEILFTDKSWKRMGQNVGQALFKYLSVEQQKKTRMNREEREEDQIKRKKSEHIYKHRLINKEKTTENNQILCCYEKSTIKNENKHLYHQIHQLEEVRENANENMSDANISEGSSDNQDEVDNLEKQKIDFLYDLLKKKTKGYVHNQKDILSFISDKFWNNRELQRLWYLKKQQLTKHQKKNEKKMETSFQFRIQESQEKSHRKPYLSKKNFSFSENFKQLNIINIHKHKQRKKNFGIGPFNAQDQFQFSNPISSRLTYNKLQTQRSSMNKTQISKLNDREQIFMPNQKGSQYKKRKKSFYNTSISTEIHKDNFPQMNPFNRRIIHFRNL